MADVIIFIVLAAVLWTLGKPLFVKQPTIQKKWTRRRVKFVNFLFYLGCILGLFMNSFFLYSTIQIALLGMNYF